MNQIRIERPTAITAGVLYLLATATGVTAMAIGAPTELAAMAGERGAVIGSTLMVTVMALACTGVAVVLYPMMVGDAERTIHRGMATGYLASRIIEGTLFLVGVVATMAMLTLSAQLADTGDEVSRPISTMLQAVPEFASMMGQTAFSVGAALLAWLLLRSGRVPRWLAIWGLIAAPMMLVAGLPLPFTGDPNSAAATLLCAPMAVQEMVFAVWLIGWGFRPPTTSMPMIEQRSARTPATTS